MVCVYNLDAIFSLFQYSVPYTQPLIWFLCRNFFFVSFHHFYHFTFHTTLQLFHLFLHHLHHFFSNDFGFCDVNQVKIQFNRFWFSSNEVVVFYHFFLVFGPKKHTQTILFISCEPAHNQIPWMSELWTIAKKIVL